jgi:hypothetical protein
MTEVTIDTLPFAERLALAEPGELVPYWGPAESLRGCRDRKDALKAHDAGLCHLVQRRLLPTASLFIYLAIKRKKAA